MPSASLLQRYQFYRPYLEKVFERARDKLTPFCEDNAYPLIGRVKALDSLADKLEQFRYKKWSEIDDLVGLTIIVPSLLEEEKVIEFLKNEFDQRELRKRGSTNKDPSVFRFDTTRVYCTLKSQANQTDDRDLISTIQFEVQVRTAFEHAWIVATHDITYKGSDVDWKALRLASQIKAAVEQLDLLVVGFSDARKHIEESRWPEVVARKWILRFVAALTNAQLISSVQHPKDMIRFSENCLRLFRNARKSLKKKWEPLEHTRVAIHACAGYFRRHKGKLPVSLSLLEIFLVAMAESELLDPPSFKEPILLSEELVMHLPNAAHFPIRFELES